MEQHDGNICMQRIRRRVLRINGYEVTISQDGYG